MAENASIVPPVSRRKALVFGAIIIFLPVAFLTLVEISLRLLSYGSDLDLVRVKNIRGREYFELNRNAGARYFGQTGVAIPEFHEERFERKKAENSRRVFCLGESTMEGFPYEFNATAPSFLRDRLRSVLPADSIEVINVGLSAVGSFVVADIMRQLMEYEPDLFVIYLGHNEFYGAYNAASAIGSGSIPWLTRLSIRLLHVRIYLALRDAHAWIAGHFGKDARAHDGTLMQQMVGNPHIPLDSETYRSTLTAYRENLIEMIHEAQARGVPILFSALVSNERDLPPFAGVFSRATDSREQEEWAILVHQADSLQRTRDTAKAVDVSRKAVALDPQNASGHFLLARTLEKIGQYELARAEYKQAKDLDALRFRATEEFQRALLEVCRGQNVPCARADSAFAAASPHGILGHELILEHVHPDVRGYFLLASVWANAIRENHLLGLAAQWQSPPPDSLLLHESMVSAFDEELGRIKTALLTRKWPFRATPDTSPFQLHDSVATIVMSYVRRELTWSDARYELAAYYARHGRLDLARRECLAVSRIIPYSYQPLLRVADYFKEEGKRDDAAMAYRRCIAAEDNPYAHMKLGLLFLEAGSDSAGIRELERGFAVDGQGGMRMPVNAKATGRYLLGVAYARTGRYEAAKESLRLALALEPGMKEARELLNQLP